MSVIRMIIADDEFIVREFLRDLDIWKELDVEIVGEASDGQEAYELCLELNPDILMTDIRMPFMDGLEVSMKLKEEGRDIRFIIISGVQDFDYAKTALSVDAAAYILKPIKIIELMEAVKKVVKGITMEKNRSTEMQSIKELLNENMYIISKNFLRNLVCGMYTQESDLNINEVKEKLTYYNIPLAINENVMVSVLQIDNYIQDTETKSEEDKLLLNFSVSNVINEVMDNYKSGISFYMEDGDHVLLFNSSAHFSEKHIEICNTISEYMKKLFDLSVSIATGRIASSITRSQTSYREALFVLKYKFYTGKNSIINIDDIKKFLNTDKEDIEYTDLYELEKELINNSRLGDADKVDAVINKIFDLHLSMKKNIDAEYVQSICIEIVCMMSRSLYEFEENIDTIVENRSVILDNIYKIDDMQELKKYMRDIFFKVANYFSKKLKNKNSGIVNRIKQIIQQRYMEGIGISMLAEEVYLSPNYISSIFKKETGENITDYIKHVRMEAAKELLKNLDLKIQDIAEMIGFDNANYFSMIFKRYTGMLPQKYRSLTTNTGNHV